MNRKGTSLLLIGLLFSGSLVAGNWYSSDYPSNYGGYEPSLYRQDPLYDLDDNLQLYEDLVRERERYERTIRSKIANWFSEKPSYVLSALAAVLGAKCGVDFLQEKGAFEEMTGDAERMLLKGYAGLAIALASGISSYVLSRTILDRLAVQPMSRWRGMRLAYASDAHKGTKYIGKRLAHIKNKIKNICRDLPMDLIDKKRQYVSKVREELLMEISREILEERIADCCNT